MIRELLSSSFCDVARLVQAQARLHPGQAAVIQDGRRYSYAEFDREIDRVAASLQRDGFRSGDVLAICAETSLEYIAAMFGALRAGVTIAPLASSSHPEAIVAMIADSGARALFVDGKTHYRLSEAKAIGVPVISLDGTGADDTWRDWLAPVGALPEPVQITPDTRFAIIYSSGTTGTPKGIVQSHGMRWAGIPSSAAMGFGPGTVNLVSTPLYSNTTLVSLLPTLGLGGTAVFMAKFSAEAFLDLSQRWRVTHAMLVPIQYARVMAEPAFDAHDLSSYRMKFCTSAPFPVSLKADVVKRWPGRLIEFYGTTEGGGTCMLVADVFPDKLHTVGRPVPGHDIRIIDEQGRELPAGSSGEVVGRSSGMMNGYHRQASRTADAEWVDAGGRRFIRSGDIGYFDEGGFLVLQDRKKDMLISGGFNIYTGDLEAALLTHDDVAEAAVVGVPSEEWGESPAGFVVLKPAREISAGAIQAWANQRLGKTQRIASVEILTALPRSPIGKILKQVLRDQWHERLAASAVT